MLFVRIGLGVFRCHYGVSPCWVFSVAFLVFFVAWCFTLPRLWCILLPPRCFMLLEWVFSVATLVFFVAWCFSLPLWCFLLPSMWCTAWGRRDAPLDRTVWLGKSLLSLPAARLPPRHAFASDGFSTPPLRRGLCPRLEVVCEDASEANAWRGGSHAAGKLRRLLPDQNVRLRGAQPCTF